MPPAARTSIDEPIRCREAATGILEETLGGPVFLTAFVAVVVDCGWLSSRDDEGDLIALRAHRDPAEAAHAGC
jgi:hypothetical protein